jgi:AcrR family transcriptional regulator
MSEATETRQRLLEAAGAVFAHKGFRNATIRDICQRAQANLAAVNYYFGDKGRLYAAVLDYAHTCARQKYPLILSETPARPASERLQVFIHNFMFSLLGEGTPSWFSKMMAREMIEPTAALNVMVAKFIRPLSQELTAIVRELLGAGATETRVRFCQLSIVGQCLHHRNSKPVIQRLFPQQQYGPEDIKAVAEHITRFSLGAIKELAGVAGID